jgi:DNA-binding IclR family transcriptional regulator
MYTPRMPDPAHAAHTLRAIFAAGENPGMDKTLLKGLMVLEAVTEVENRPRTIEELASRVGLTRSNTHRTLQTLVHAGYVVKDDDSGGYRATVRLFELGARQLAQLDVRKLAQPAMRRLTDETGETVHLSVLDGMDVVYIDKIDSAQPIRAYSYIGGRAPAYAVATGKALLAHQPDGYIARCAGQLQAHTPKTITSMAALEDEMRKVRRQGYAINRGEWRASVGGVAVAIFNSLEQPVAALGISGPLERLGASRMKELAPTVAACAREVSRCMGHHGS